MRRLLVAGFIAVATQSTAFAADLPILRGALHEPAPACCQTVWQGFYVGGQAGYGASSMALYEFSPVPTSNAIWPFLQDATHRATMFGAFGGYNAQYENVVLGLRRQLHARERSPASRRPCAAIRAGNIFRSFGSMSREGFRLHSRARRLHHG